MVSAVPITYNDIWRFLQARGGSRALIDRVRSADNVYWPAIAQAVRDAAAAERAARLAAVTPAQVADAVAYGRALFSHDPAVHTASDEQIAEKVLGFATYRFVARLPLTIEEADRAASSIRTSGMKNTYAWGVKHLGLPASGTPDDYLVWYGYTPQEVADYRRSQRIAADEQKAAREERAAAQKTAAMRRLFSAGSLVPNYVVAVSAHANAVKSLAKQVRYEGDVTTQGDLAVRLTGEGCVPVRQPRETSYRAQYGLMNPVTSTLVELGKSANDLAYWLRETGAYPPPTGFNSPPPATAHYAIIPYSLPEAIALIPVEARSAAVTAINARLAQYAAWFTGAADLDSLIALLGQAEPDIANGLRVAPATDDATALFYTRDPERRAASVVATARTTLSDLRTVLATK